MMEISFGKVVTECFDKGTNQVYGIEPGVEFLNPSEAAEQLFEEYGDEIYRYVCFILRNRPDAEDVVQDIFVQVLRGWHRFEHRSEPKTWLWAITNNTIKKRIRRRRIEVLNKPIPTDHDPVQDPTFDVDFEMAIRSLPLQQQQVFVQRIVHDLSSQQTAHALGWSESKVKVTLHRATKALKNWFSEEGEVQ